MTVVKVGDGVIGCQSGLRSFHTLWVKAIVNAGYDRISSCNVTLGHKIIVPYEILHIDRLEIFQRFLVISSLLVTTIINKEEVLLCVNLHLLTLDGFQ